MTPADRELAESARLGRFLATGELPIRYDDDGGVSAESDSLSHGPGALLTPECRGHCVHGSKP